LILDVVVETSNPADAERFLPMLERQIAHCGVPPRQVAADGGYASQDNLAAAKARGITDVAFHKKRGLAVEDMAKSRWVYRKLRNFRAGIEDRDFLPQTSLRFGTKARPLRCCGVGRGKDVWASNVWFSASLLDAFRLSAACRPPSLRRIRESWPKSLGRGDL
jgi:IS5 family transposase